MRHLLKLFIIPTLAMVAGPAFADGVDGVWACKANGDIPLGLLEISGDTYSFQTTNTAWEPVDNKSNGSGALSYEGSRIQPVDGPLLDSFEVYGEAENGVLYWYNDAGALMGCWPHP